MENVFECEAAARPSSFKEAVDRVQQGMDTFYKPYQNSIGLCIISPNENIILRKYFEVFFRFFLFSQLALFFF